jgi:hypothetical protein
VTAVALSPLGFPPKVKARGLAQSVDTLSGRKVYLVDVGFENSDVFMVQLGAWLAAHEPGITTELVRWHDMHKPDPDLCRRIQHDGDAAILGVGL